MRFIVACTGGRNYTNRDAVRKVLSTLNDYVDIQDAPSIIVGDATGADAHVRAIAKELGIPFEVFVADWVTLGKAAGPIRNQQMIACEPRLVIAFPGGKGTADMVKRARKAQIEVIEISE